MIDLHSHLLPNVDDGSRSIESSVAVLEKFAADGVEIVVLTPHLNASRVAEAPYDRHLALLEELRAAAPTVPELRLGWEIMLDQPGRDLRAPNLSLGGSGAVLVEFPLSGVPAQGGDELHRIRASGVVPVLAHPERYWGCTTRLVDGWKRAGAVIQMDTAGLLGKGRIAKLSRELLEEGLVDMFSSDNHGDCARLAAGSLHGRTRGAAHAHQRATPAGRRATRAGAAPSRRQRHLRALSRDVPRPVTRRVVGVLLAPPHSIRSA